MKTNYFTKRNFSVYSFLGLIGILTASCSSYQSSSYYDSDGIYSKSNREQVAPQENQNSNQYKQYFSSLQNAPVETFTNVDNYNSYYTDSTATAQPQYASGYAGWGGDSDNVTVNVYGSNWGYGMWNNWYGPNWGWGWNSWYGPGWGIGWGWGWNNWYGGWGWGTGYGWGWGYPYYGGYYGGWNNWHNNYAYNGGRRGGYYGNGNTPNYSVRNYSTGRRAYTQDGVARNPRSYTTTSARGFTPRSSQATRSNTTQSNNNTYYNTPRSNNSNNTSVRSSTPSRSSSSPSYNSGGSRSGGYSSGGGSYGGGGGGGRSGGGGRR